MLSPYSRLPRLRAEIFVESVAYPSRTQNQSQNPSDFFLRGLYKSLCMVLKISILAGYMGQLPIFLETPIYKSGQSPVCTLKSSLRLKSPTAKSGHIIWPSWPPCGLSYFVYGGIIFCGYWFCLTYYMNIIQIHPISQRPIHQYPFNIHPSQRPLIFTTVQREVVGDHIAHGAFHHGRRRRQTLGVFGLGSSVKHLVGYNVGPGICLLVYEPHWL